MPSYRVFASLRVLPLVLLLAACESGGAVDLLPLDPQEVRVSETLTLSLPVQNPTGRAITLRIEPPMPSIPAFESVTSLTSSPRATRTSRRRMRASSAGLPSRP